MRSASNRDWPQIHCDVVVIGAGPYGLSAAAYLRDAGVETRIFGEPMSFWTNHMPAGMFLRSNWAASHIADPAQRTTLDAYRLATGNQLSAPIPLEQFVQYGKWYQSQLVPNVDRRPVANLDLTEHGFGVTLSDGETFTCRRVIVASGIGAFVCRPPEFDAVPAALASHSSEHQDLNCFKGCRVVVVGGGQSALESAALLCEAGADVEVIVRQSELNWVGLHPRLHHLGPISYLLYSNRDVGPAGISQLVAMPWLFRKFPRSFQALTSYRAIRPAGSAWLRPRLSSVPISLGHRIVSASPTESQLRLTLDDGSERRVDHAILATGFRVDVSRIGFLGQEVRRRLEMAGGYPVLKRGLESSVSGLHFLGKPAAWSFGPLLGFVSGTEFASKELVRCIARKNGTTKRNDQ